MERYYRFCQQNVGRVARITDRGGRVHVGRIVRVSPNKVFIAPMVRRGRPGFGYGYGYYGGWWGWGPVYGLGLGLIAGVALAGLFFW
ncbi:hypothetical protein P9D34_05775 [Bacillus swezeyi]|uniref:Uncharacterized protein n=1 Tax=Bacillus swezeyi TaxID=1925020 RepID=A0A1R1QEA7_9BACI|nr:hypothetical protein [Bacillus swezeyi]MEC1259966.1 hypothetical protein [Bacillus swezeyi]MED1741392.1 hypothetical protein [Bacillus swezeyi]MED2929802.1 hypothetical protein [Bacillus swezeyi]MED2945111.1 hypothetical protein [Bacillus swezeyi]MED2963171.1 hypothetical protein [Bacillus swezeyi]